MLLWFGAFGAALVTPACHRGASEAGTTHALTGTVLEVKDQAVVIDHDAIPGVMPAMVMELPAPDAPPLAPGDRVTGVLNVGSGPTRLEQLRVVGHADPAPAPTPRRWEDSLLVGEVLDAVDVQTNQGPVVVGAGQGRPTVLTFLFVGCPVPEFCPLLATKLAALQTAIGGGRIVAVTLDPEHDTLEQLAAYGTRYGADGSRWVLGRLEPPALAALLARVDVRTSVDAGTLTHDLRLLVLDADGRLVHREVDNGWDVERLGAIVRGAPDHSPGL